MRRPPFTAILALAAGLAAGPAPAQDAAGVTSYVFDGGFEDAVFGVETAITGRGFVVDHVSHVGEMLNRTAADVGATGQTYEEANVYLFCSATLSREMMEADILNIAYCPYGVFVYRAAGEEGEVRIGYRHYPDGPMQKVQDLLDEIAREAAGLD